MARRVKRRKADPMALLEGLIAKPPKAREYCLTCKELDRWGAMLQRWYDARKSGETTVAWQQFYSRVLVPAGYQLSLAAMMNHVRTCMGGMV